MGKAGERRERARPGRERLGQGPLERGGNARVTGAGEASETGPGEGTATAQEQLEWAREQRIPNAPASASVESPLNSVLGPSSASEPGLQAAAQGIVVGPPAPQPPLHYPPRSCPGIRVLPPSSPRVPSTHSTSILRASTSSTTSS